MQFLIKFSRSCLQMDRWYLIIALWVAVLPIKAQVGIKIVTTLAQYKIAETVSNEKLFSTKAGLGIDYWFRLKKYRLEVMPAIHFQTASEELVLNDQSIGVLNWSFIDFAPGFQIYPLDFKNDCQCPTFSKQGKFIKKGLFLHLAPGIGRSVLNSNTIQGTPATDWIGFVRLGIGIDIGLSDLITWSPSVSYQLSQPLDWSPFFQSISSQNLRINNGLFLAARFGFRMDKKRY